MRTMHIVRLATPLAFDLALVLVYALDFFKNNFKKYSSE